MCDGLIQYEPMSDPKRYEPKDPRDIKIEQLEKDLDKLQKDVESLMKKVVGNENKVKKKQDKLQEDFGKCDAKILTVENKLLSKISTLEQKVKNIPKENKMLQEKPVAIKGKRNVTATAVESGASPEKKKLPGPTYNLSSIPMAVSKTHSIFYIVIDTYTFYYQ